YTLTLAAPEGAAIIKGVEWTKTKRNCGPGFAWTRSGRRNLRGRHSGKGACRVAAGACRPPPGPGIGLRSGSMAGHLGLVDRPPSGSRPAQTNAANPPAARALP